MTDNRTTNNNIVVTCVTALQRLWLTEREDTSSANDDHCIIVTGNKSSEDEVNGKCLEDLEVDCD